MGKHVELLAYTPAPVVVAQTAAGMCRATGPTKKGLEVAIESGHESVLEHVSFTFRITDLSRSFLAQITRHRLASFSVESQRYCKYTDNVNVIVPPSITNNDSANQLYRETIQQAANAYTDLIGMGVDTEDARFVLPEATVTNMVVTMNARELRHFFSLRCCNRAQWEIRAVADEMLALCKQTAPELFKDAGAPCVRGECREVYPCGEPRV